MKTVLITFSLIAVIFAAPKSKILGFLNVYKDPLVPITHKSNLGIIGGQEAVPHSIPYQVFLEIYDNSQNGWYCGGSLISVNYVVTTGHCGIGATEVYITLGAHNIYKNEDTQIRVVSKNVKVHEQWDPRRNINDIAVIKLPTSVELTDAIQTVSLPSIDSDYVGVRAKASGWGLTSGSNTQISKVLEYVDLLVISNKDCKKLTDVDDSILCTSGEENTGACNGDSGGPLVYNNELIGIVSFGVSKCPLGYPSGFTRVSSFKTWIRNNTDI